MILQLLRKEFVRMARCCTEAVQVLGHMVAGEREQAYHDDLKTKNGAFQARLSEFIGDQREGVENLSEYLDIISSPRKLDRSATEEHVSAFFLKKNGDSFSALQDA